MRVEPVIPTRLNATHADFRYKAWLLSFFAAVYISFGAEWVIGGAWNFVIIAILCPLLVWCFGWQFNGSYVLGWHEGNAHLMEAIGDYFNPLTLRTQKALSESPQYRYDFQSFLGQSVPISAATVALHYVFSIGDQSASHSLSVWSSLFFLWLWAFFLAHYAQVEYLTGFKEGRGATEWALRKRYFELEERKAGQSEETS